VDKIQIVENNQRDRMYYSKELSEAGHDVASLNSLPLFRLIDQHMEKKVESRKHMRFQVSKDVFALIRLADAKQLLVADRSMGEIACAVYRSKAVRFGRIDNISMGGLSFRYITGEEQSNHSLVLDILVADPGFYLENITFKNISDFEMDDGFAFNSFKMRLNRVQFERLEPVVFMKLKHFVKNYGVSEVQ
jgi:hypothetical protein